MTDEEIQIENARRGEKVRRLFGTKQGKEVLELLGNHFQINVPSAVIAGFQTNETMYQDGSKAVFLTIEQIRNGELWGDSSRDRPENEIEQQ